MFHADWSVESELVVRSADTEPHPDVPTFTDPTPPLAAALVSARPSSVTVATACTLAVRSSTLTSEAL